MWFLVKYLYVSRPFASMYWSIGPIIPITRASNVAGESFWKRTYIAITLAYASDQIIILLYMRCIPDTNNQDIGATITNPININCTNIYM